MIRYYEIVIPDTEADQRWPDVDTFVGGIFAAITGLGWTIQLNPCWSVKSEQKKQGKQPCSP